MRSGLIFFLGALPALLVSFFIGALVFITAGAAVVTGEFRMLIWVVWVTAGFAGTGALVYSVDNVPNRETVVCLSMGVVAAFFTLAIPYVGGLILIILLWPTFTAIYLIIEWLEENAE